VVSGNLQCLVNELCETSLEQLLRCCSSQIGEIFVILQRTAGWQLWRSLTGGNILFAFRCFVIPSEVLGPELRRARLLAGACPLWIKSSGEDLRGSMACPLKTADMTNA
jgi:hypothetical protein